MYGGVEATAAEAESLIPHPRRENYHHHHQHQQQQRRRLSRSPSPIASPKPTTSSKKTAAATAAWRRRKVLATATTTWHRNKGLVLVLVSQFFGCLMNVSISILENEPEHPMQPLQRDPFVFAITQILFVRMSITTFFCLTYMYFAKTPHSPFGHPSVRPLLYARAFGSFFGVFGLYFSLLYLPLSDATVLTFLSPILACWAYSILLHEPLARMELVAGLVSLFGVILIARPTVLFSSEEPPHPDNPTAGGSGSGSGDSTTTMNFPHATPSQRLLAVSMAMLGVCGNACAYTTIRCLGKRAHPLITTNYFGAWCTLLSSILIFLPLPLPPFTSPSTAFHLPSTLKQGLLLLILSVSGFILQFLMTVGLAYEKSSRATNMVYSQMLFALAVDKIVWGVSPGWWSLAGSALILGSAVFVAVQSEMGMGKDEVGGVPDGGADMEEEEEGDREERRSLLRGGVQEARTRTISRV
ncbi:MAG: hypothetical protein M1834_004498 [Cirrosporium novae-zelandiae]|nr:MAG: hypothetical protein M1834_004498 [Cirrosporium novae-zelandiae]